MVPKGLLSADQQLARERRKIKELRKVLSALVAALDERAGVPWYLEELAEARALLEVLKLEDQQASE
jgi:hypothetical protein